MIAPAQATTEIAAQNKFAQRGEQIVVAAIKRNQFHQKKVKEELDNSVLTN